MGRLLRALRRWRGIMPLDQGESARGAKRRLDNLDGLTGANAGDIGRSDGEIGGGGMPPHTWVKSYDEARPRK